MGKLSIDLNSIKAAGVYTVEIDNSQRAQSVSTLSLKMIVGFSNKGPFNRPVLLTLDSDRTTVFGDIDSKLEYKGCYFNRFLRTALTDGPVIALNLLKVDENYSGPDLTNYAAFSLDAATANPRVIEDEEKYGQYDYLAESLDNTIYGTVKGSNLPFVGLTPFASLYNRSRFWIADKDLVTAAAAARLQSDDSGTFEYSNLLNFGNVGTEEFSLLIYKPSNVNGYDVTAESWYGGKENIPYGWIRPYDNISDYFVSVICIKGNWTNYSILSTDPVWGSYFDKKGIIKNKIGSFMRTDGISVLGSWQGCIIPDFIDKQGSNLSIEKKINAATERTGLVMAFNNDAANVLAYDYSGKDQTSEDPYKGSWGIDIDGDKEIAGGEKDASFIVDMCGHGAFVQKQVAEYVWEDVSLDSSLIPANSSIYNATRKRTSVSPNYTLACLLATDSSVELGEGTGNYASCGTYVDASVMNSFDPLVDASACNENVISKLVSDKYFIISDQGTLSGKKTATIKKVEILTVNSSIIDSSVTMIYGTAERTVHFTLNYVTINGQAYITSLNNDAKMRIKVKVNDIEEAYNGINFLSYNYIKEDGDGVEVTLSDAYYFNDPTLWEDNCPVEDDNKNMFIITNIDYWKDANIKVGDFVHNITYNNEVGETEQYKLIPGLSRITKKQFIQVNNKQLTYKGLTYTYNGPVCEITGTGNIGFYLFTAVSPVLIESHTIKRQLPIDDDSISHSLRFIPMKGLTLSSRHRPGYDTSGNLDIEGGIEKIYGVLNDDGIRRGLMNKTMVNYRYIVDSMSYGLGVELGGKVEISKVAYDRGKSTAILSLPSAKQFAVSSNPYFCDTYTPGVSSRKPFNPKYIPDGGNSEMGSTVVFSLPTLEHGASFTACFWPNLIYTENGKSLSIPPAADACNVLNRKFTGVTDPYAICANMNGIISNPYVTDIEFNADVTDREYLEPFGVNTIIKENGNIMIYGNLTAYQSVKSDLNKLHVRENLNTAEIECQAVLEKFNFLYNTAATRASIVQQLTPILQAMQTSGAVAQYEIICDETNNTAEIIEEDFCIVNVNLWMNHGMEKIVQVFTVNRLSSSAE